MDDHEKQMEENLRYLLRTIMEGVPQQKHVSPQVIQYWKNNPSGLKERIQAIILEPHAPFVNLMNRMESLTVEVRGDYATFGDFFKEISAEVEGSSGLNRMDFNNCGRLAMLPWTLKKGTVRKIGIFSLRHYESLGYGSIASTTLSCQLQFPLIEDALLFNRARRLFLTPVLFVHPISPPEQKYAVSEINSRESVRGNEHSLTYFENNPEKIWPAYSKIAGVIRE